MLLLLSRLLLLLLLLRLLLQVGITCCHRCARHQKFLQLLLLVPLACAAVQAAQGGRG